MVLFSYGKIQEEKNNKYKQNQYDFLFQVQKKPPKTVFVKKEKKKKTVEEKKLPNHFSTFRRWGKNKKKKFPTIHYSTT